MSEPTSTPASTTQESKQSSFFSQIPEAPLDPIIGTKTLFLADPDPNKVNLGIGAYRTDEGKPYVLQAVKEAEKLLMQDDKLDKEYLAIDGLPAFYDKARELVFGSESAALKEKRVATVQCLSGTGSLRVAAEFLAKFLPENTQVLYSEPTWENHKNIFTCARMPNKSYRYWDAAHRRLDFDGMLEDIKAAPKGSVVVLHACAHNPTGVDPTVEQWKKICEVVKESQHFPFFDLAYQGFATGDLDRDAFAVRYFIEQGMELLVCQSFAKNFGLYNERVGTCSVVCHSKDAVKPVFSQLNATIRPMYSNPPAHGARIVHRVLTEPKLYALWLEEMKGMSERIRQMRQLLFDELVALKTPGDWSHIVSQIGMFSYTGLTPTQCERMISKHHIYLVKNGRISMAGVNSSNVKYLANAINETVTNQA